MNGIISDDITIKMITSAYMCLSELIKANNSFDVKKRKSLLTIAKDYIEAYATSEVCVWQPSTNKVYDINHCDVDAGKLDLELYNEEDTAAFYSSLIFWSQSTLHEKTYMTIMKLLSSGNEKKIQYAYGVLYKHWLGICLLTKIMSFKDIEPEIFSIYKDTKDSYLSFSLLLNFWWTMIANQEFISLYNEGEKTADIWVMVDIYVDPLCRVQISDCYLQDFSKLMKK